LYIIDSSTNTHCISFLRYARDVLGANVLFSDTNLNEVEALLTEIGRKISGSSDFILKVDTDEFLTVYSDNDDHTTVSEYLSGFAQNANHPLRLLPGDARVGTVQPGKPNKSVCEEDIHSTPDKFMLGAVVDLYYFKSVFDSRQNIKTINLGGHYFVDKEQAATTRFHIVHYHARCIEIEIENTKRVLERHDFISPSDSDEEAKAKLAKMFRCSTEDMCNTCPFKGNFASVHKVIIYLKYLDCEEQFENEFYGQDGGEMFTNTALNELLVDSYGRSDV